MFNLPGARSTEVPPAQSEAHYWADYFELHCLIDQDGTFSAERLSAMRRLQRDFEATNRNAQDVSSLDLEIALAESVLVQFDDEDPHSRGDGALMALLDEEIDDAVELLDDRLEDDLDDGEVAMVGLDVDLADQEDEWAEGVFALLRDRADSLGDQYPFDLDAANLILRRSDRGDRGVLYVFLLGCSLLAYLQAGMRSKFTKHFEIVATAGMRALLPPPFEVDHYGTASRSSRFIGSKFERLVGLARTLGAQVLASKDEFKPRDNGDNGLDIVGWLAMGDSQKSVHAFFAQCACGKKWEEKQYEASHARWRQYMHLTPESTAMTFIPEYFRARGEEWAYPSQVATLLVDRLRLVRLLGPLEVHTHTTQLVEKLISYAKPSV